MKKKRTRLDIVGRWVQHNDKIVKYTLIDSKTKCSCCNGTDLHCPICKGNSIQKKIKWYEITKILRNIKKYLI